MIGGMDLSNIFQFLSPAVPAAIHDIERMRQFQEDFEKGVDPRDVIVADKDFQGFEKEASVGTWRTKKRKPKNQAMSEEQKEENRKIEDIRRHIEFAFGTTKLAFDCLLRPWRHDHSWLTPVAQFCCAFHNVKLRAERNGENYEIEWKHPIPPIPSQKKKKDMVKFHCLLNIFSWILHPFCFVSFFICSTQVL
jgi:hypothetical protein